MSSKYARLRSLNNYLKASFGDGYYFSRSYCHYPQVTRVLHDEARLHSLPASGMCSALFRVQGAVPTPLM